MIETVSDERPAAPSPDLEEDANLRGVVFLSYALFLVASFTGISALIGVIIAYIKRSEANGTIWHSHFDNLITVFWVMVAGIVLGLLAWPLAIGAFVAHQFYVWPWPSLAVLPIIFSLVVFPILVIWYFYRVIRGLIQAAKDEPY